MGAKGTPATVVVAKAKVEHRIHEYDPADLAHLAGGSFAALAAT
jgi:hypothetical protein